MLSVRATKLVGYLIGCTPRSTVGNNEKWLCEDALVMSWLLNAIEPTLSPQYMMMDSAKDVWDAIAQQFSQGNNYAQAYKISKQAREMRQGELSLATYYSTRTHLWQQLDTYRTHKPFIPVELVTYQKDTEKERVYEFLAGLNPEFDQIRVQVLGRVPFPTLREAYNMVQREETRRSSMLPSRPPDRSALVTMSRPSLSVLDSVNNQADKAVPHCDYCNKDNYTWETCFKLHGRPRGQGGRYGSRGGKFNSWGKSTSQAHSSEGSVGADSVAISDPTPVLSSDQILALQRLISQQPGLSSTGSSSNGSANGTSNRAQSGIVSSTYNVSTSHKSSWCPDSCANEHMTSSFEVFDSYTVCSGKDKIRVANGSLSPVSGKGLVYCIPIISLSFVLHVPSLCVNLLYIYRITWDLNCCVTFFSTHCLSGTGHRENDWLW
ncbi:UBN2_3 domain-containing protein [Cephalotus follicularis]|uniref:UBN2_3 domain-containing protein n=1 Tax=Cephalotus follicularis TaxID=3775 RepID=A0A1Q3BE99_CEPFO|nr:UBN2_3 domain-containing protein [Cephalotus follicularis]